MRRQRLLVVLLLLLLAISAVSALGQGQPPLVVFVLNSEIGSASVLSSTPDGLSGLENIFRSLGAQTQVINLIEPIPEAADVVVLVGPQQRLNLIATTRLWVHLSRGKHLLLALDPIGYGGNASDDVRSPLYSLLMGAYGVMTQDTFITEPWFTRDSVALLSGAYSLSHPDIVPHPVIEPLMRYDLPVQIWASRSVMVEPLGVDSIGIPLLQTSTAYGEANPAVFALGADAAPFELNLGIDLLGRLNVAGLGENTLVRSRVAILGDSQMVQNGYGLAPVLGTTAPRYPGNRIFVERLAAWLIGLPEDQWPALPAGFTWVALDGDGRDWPADVPLTTKDRTLAVPAAYNIRDVMAFHNDSYLYLLAQPFGTPSAATRVEITLSNGLTVVVTPEMAFVNTPVGSQPVPDAALAVGQALELRLPLRLLGDDGTVTEICLFDNSSPAAPQRRDCLSDGIEVAGLDEREPFDLRFPAGPLATISSIRDVMIHSLPDATSQPVALFRIGQVMSVVGRSPAGDWLMVRGAGYSGWVQTALVVLNTDPSSLPLVQ
jgi:hypothetical protein